MTGVYQHSLDAKGRLFIPANLREKLGQSFYVTVSPEQCLSGYPMEKWNRLKEKYEAMSYKDRKKYGLFFLMRHSATSTRRGGYSSRCSSASSQD